MTKTEKFDTMSAPCEGGGGERSDEGGAPAGLCEKGERSDLPPAFRVDGRGNRIELKVVRIASQSQLAVNERDELER